MQYPKLPVWCVETIIDNKFLVVGRPDIGQAEEDAVISVLRSGWLGNGSVASEFEIKFAQFLNIEKAVAVNSCTMGLYLALKAEGIKAGDEVITSPITFAATLNAILATGAKPVFVDVNSDACIDADKIESAITSKTKAVIPIHMAGSPCNMPMINMIAEKHNLIVIEDAAHAFGGSFMGKSLGTFGHYGVFSFYPTKNITAGEGGMVVAQDPKKLDIVRRIASQGLTASAWDRYGNAIPRDYEVSDIGFKGLMPDILAAIGLAQLNRWPELKHKRFQVWDIYTEAFGPRVVGHSQHLYTVRVSGRDKFREMLHKIGIGTGIHYKSLHLEPAYKQFVKKNQSFPNATRIGETTLSLPLSSAMTVEDAHKVVSAVRMVFKEMKVLTV